MTGASAFTAPLLSRLATLLCCGRAPVCTIAPIMRFEGRVWIGAESPTIVQQGPPPTGPVRALP